MSCGAGETAATELLIVLSGNHPLEAAVDLVREALLFKDEEELENFLVCYHFVVSVEVLSIIRCLIHQRLVGDVLGLLDIFHVEATEILFDGKCRNQANEGQTYPEDEAP